MAHSGLEAEYIAEFEAAAARENELGSEVTPESTDDGAASCSSSSMLQNGMTVQEKKTKETDRYGFTGGDQYTDPDSQSLLPIAVVRRRELKWLDMMANWEKWMNKRYKKVRERCRKGIPPSLRARAWQFLSGSKYTMESHRGTYQNYKKLSGDPRCVDDIQKDLHRQFPFHEMFMARGGHGQEDLFHVLKAYTIHNPSVGYCQAQAPIAAILLMHMPAEHAFWCLVSICERYLPGYYSPGLEAVQVDGDVFFGLLKRTNPEIHKHFKKQKIDPILYMTEWFMCVFTRTLPWSTVLRVWDMFFFEGVKVMFRVALVLFRQIFSTPEQLSSCPSMYETMEKIRHIPSEFMQEEFLVFECGKIPLSERDMEKEHAVQVAKRRSAREKASKSGDSKSSRSKGRKKEKKTEGLSPSSSNS